MSDTDIREIARENRGYESSLNVTEGGRGEKGIKGDDFSFVRNYIASSFDENILFERYISF